ncbi:hypothetical protein MSG28_010833 [Choristoneura fumiferana]|uniref:Uncharacterized protein n=1 Tax=Choristoneura fumiferana TaxID=7141 RepID=A0ACC0KPL3_CHOFU|nr:hypothetical protein MSG28_010833 [Choristoneura fumiferana]
MPYEVDNQEEEDMVECAEELDEERFSRLSFVKLSPKQFFIVSCCKGQVFLTAHGHQLRLNTAEGKRYKRKWTPTICTTATVRATVQGLPLMDLPTTDISKPCPRPLLAWVLSRSATCAIAFLMIKRGMSSQRRWRWPLPPHIHPNEGFIRRVLVHCFMGVSRSATCAIAFLMIKRGMSLTEAMALVRSRRDIHPNEGFIRQLQMLDRELRVSRIR